MWNKSEGTLTIISGFSGAGKGTIVKRLVNDYPDTYALSISATTRKPREGERHGIEYFFMEHDEFESKIREKEFIEYAQYVGNYYGTPKGYVFEKMKEGKDVILEIEVQGALKVKKQYPDSLLLFVTPPDAATLYERLKGRGTESEETIISRMQRATEESDEILNYDYIIVNDDLDNCVKYTHDLIRTQRSRTDKNRLFIENVKKDLVSYLKGEKK